MTEKDNAGIKVPPPLIFLSGLLAGGVIAYFYPFAIFQGWRGVIFGAPLVVAGVIAILSAFFKFQSVGTDVKPWKPTTAIVAEGIYHYTRNPMYLGMTLIYTGIAFTVNSVWFFPFLVVILLAIHYLVILKEEKYLESKFGKEYLNFKKSVRRWV